MSYVLHFIFSPAVWTAKLNTEAPTLSFHSRLKTFLFCKSFPLQPFFFFFSTDYTVGLHDSPDFYCYFSAYSVIYFLVFFLFYTF